MQNWLLVFLGSNQSVLLRAPNYGVYILLRWRHFSMTDGAAGFNPPPFSYIFISPSLNLKGWYLVFFVPNNPLTPTSFNLFSDTPKSELPKSELPNIVLKTRFLHMGNQDPWVPISPVHICFLHMPSLNPRIALLQSLYSWWYSSNTGTSTKNTQYWSDVHRV